MRTDIAACYGGLAAITLAVSVVPVPVVVQMLVTTVLTIYIGCQNGITISQAAVKDGKDGGKEGQRAAPVQERMQSNDVYLFPIIGSVVLFSLYLVFKIFPKELVLVIVRFYFVAIGAIVLGQKIASLLETLLPPAVTARLASHNVRLNIKYLNLAGAKISSAVDTVVGYIPKPVVDFVKSLDSSSSSPSADSAKGKANAAAAAAAAAAEAEKRVAADGSPLSPDEIEVTMLDIVATALAGVVGLWYLVSNHWASNNIFGIAFSIQAIELLNLGSYFNGAVLLAGLFVYDIFWVFGTDVMVTVAKNIDGPIKLLYPRGGDVAPAMLGLGDIVIPGIFIALMLRFDHKMGRVAANTKPFPTPYFLTNLAAYALGLCTTLFVMFAFKHAQPALLYLVPAALGSSLGYAALRGEVSTLIKYADEEPEDGKAVAAPASASAAAASTAATNRSRASSRKA